MDEKMEADQSSLFQLGGARQLLLKHMHTKARHEPRFQVVESDALGPLVVTMDCMGVPQFWVRVARADQASSRAKTDWWFEMWPKELALSEVSREVAKTQQASGESPVSWTRSVSPRVTKRARRKATK